MRVAKDCLCTLCWCVNSSNIGQFILFKRMINSGRLSASVGEFVRIGEQFAQHGAHRIARTLVPFVQRFLGNEALQDIVLSYAIALWFCTEVRWCILCG